MRPVDWNYLLLAVAVLMAVAGTALFMMSCKPPHSMDAREMRYALRNAQLGYLWTITALVPLCIAGVIMWDALGWPP